MSLEESAYDTRAEQSLLEAECEVVQAVDAQMAPSVELVGDSEAGRILERFKREISKETMAAMGRIARVQEELGIEMPKSKPHRIAYLLHRRKVTRGALTTRIHSL